MKQFTFRFLETKSRLKFSVFIQYCVVAEFVRVTSQNARLGFCFRKSRFLPGAIGPTEFDSVYFGDYSL